MSQLPTWKDIVCVAALKSADDYKTKVVPAVNTGRNVTAGGLNWLARFIATDSKSTVRLIK